MHPVPHGLAPGLSKPSTLCAAILASVLFCPPAWADDPCIDTNGNVTAGGTDQGNEHGRTNSNTTCSATSSAYGQGNNASGTSSSAIGSLNFARGAGANAFGRDNFASGGQSSAFGISNQSRGGWSSAFGYNNVVHHDYGVAVGYGNNTSDPHGIAVGSRNIVSGGTIDFPAEGLVFGTQAFGQENRVSAGGASAFGNGNEATGEGAFSFGVFNSVQAAGAGAFGYGNIVTDFRGLAVGTLNRVNSRWGAALGTGNIVAGQHSVALGNDNTIVGDRALAIGNMVLVTAGRGLAIGSQVTYFDAEGQEVFMAETSVTGFGGVAVGNSVAANGRMSAAFGIDAVADADYSVAIGYNAVADREHTVSVGSATRMNQIANLADGTEDHDAVNLRQLRAATVGVSDELVSWFGAGAAFADGVFTAPVYVIQSGSYGDVGAAFGAVDAALTDINQRIVASGGVQGERGYSAYEVAVQGGYGGSEAQWLASLQGPAGPGGPQGPEGPAGGGPRSVVYDDDARGSLTLAGTDGTVVSNVADGVEAMDAVNVRQMQAGDADTLASANRYTDTRFTAWDAQLDSIQRGIDDRFHQQDRRIDRQGAMAGAFAGMAMNTAGLSGQNRIGVGVGVQGGEQALAVGYQRAVGQRASVSLGGAFSGSEKSVMGGAGFSW